MPLDRPARTGATPLSRGCRKMIGAWDDARDDALIRPFESADPIENASERAISPTL